MTAAGDCGCYDFDLSIIDVAPGVVTASELVFSFVCVFVFVFVFSFIFCFGLVEPNPDTLLDLLLADEFFAFGCGDFDPLLIPLTLALPVPVSFDLTLLFVLALVFALTTTSVLPLSPPTPLPLLAPFTDCPGDLALADFVGV